jgi:hypothetical protein
MTRSANTVVAATALLVAATACSDSLSHDITQPATPATVTSITADGLVPTAARVSYSGETADSVRAHFLSAAGDSGVTPWFPAEAGAVPVLGLLPSTTYEMTLESGRGANSAISAQTAYTTPPLPPALAGVRLSLVSGTRPGWGYTLASLIAPGGDGYLVAFDGDGNIRWFRDFGKLYVQEAKQQTNGDFTVFVGNSIGDNPAAGAFVEVTPQGDSVRAITATGSPYTDGHELQVVSDASGHRIADYLFGYDIRSVDETSYGGGPADQIAGHQLLRISAAGQVDTLMQGWGYWHPADKVDPPTADQSIDHPNSIAFDVDGGIVVSYRNLGAVIKIDPQTRAVLWQMGGARNQFTFINDPLNGFGGQHDVQVLPNGHFLVFDNGVTHSPQSSRAVEYAVDEPARTATMVWQYAPSPLLFNEFTGSAQRLSNGNTVIAWTNAGLIDEVSSNGTLLDRMQLYNSPGVANTSAYRAIRISNLYRYVKP